MSHLSNTQFLEYWFDRGLDEGLSVEEAVIFAEQKVESYS
jgi:hypothetical protein